MTANSREYWRFSGLPAMQTRGVDGYQHLGRTQQAKMRTAGWVGKHFGNVAGRGLSVLCPLRSCFCHDVAALRWDLAAFSALLYTS